MAFPPCVRCLPLVQSAMIKRVERRAGSCGNQGCPFQGQGDNAFHTTFSDTGKQSQYNGK